MPRIQSAQVIYAVIVIEPAVWVRRSSSVRSEKSILIVLLLALLVSSTIRLVPLAWSPLPYNIDGLSEYRTADDIVSTGHLEFDPNSSHADSYVTDMPLFGIVIAFFSVSLGLDPLTSAQIVAALLGTIAILLGYLIFTQHFPSTRGSVTGLVVLALLGSFVFSTACVWKETLGILLILLSLFAYHLRDSLPYRALLLLSLVLLVFTHHQSTVVGFLIISFATMIALSNHPRAARLSQKELLDILTLFVIWALAIAYYTSVDLPYLDYLSPAGDLYLYLAVGGLLLAVAVRMSRRSGALTKFPFEFVMILVGASLMLYNYYDPIFPGTPSPSSLILVPMLAYLLLAVLAWPGYQLATANRGPSKNLVLAMVFAPLSLILFAFLRGLDETSYTVIFRTFDFLMPAFAILVGLGFALAIKGRERLGAVAGVFFVVVCASTLPIAYSTQDLFGVQNQTYQFEYDAVEWFSAHGVDGYASDQRLSETGWRLFDMNASRGLPYDLVEGIALDAGSFYVVEGQWSTNGAQEFPFGVVIVDEETMDGVIDESDMVYIGGPLESQLILFRT